jgi:hydroxymethylbilane synthase
MKEDARGAAPYAVALDLRGWSVVVAGGGGVAERKVRGLLEAGARVTVVAPRIGDALRQAAERREVQLIERRFETGDLAGARLAFALTDDEAANAEIVSAAQAQGVLVNDGGDNARGDFANALAYRVGPITFTVDTGGVSPSFALRLRDELRERFDERYARAAITLGRARTYVTAVVPPDLRARVMGALAALEIDSLAAMNPGVVENEVERIALALAGSVPGTEPYAQLVCATRASALAMWQARYAIAKLASTGLVSTVLQVTTKGDRVQDRALHQLGSDNVFVTELESALRERRADYAVHSCKDLPSTLSADMQLAAIGARQDARDVFCSERYASFETLPQGAVVGTSSPRRHAQLRALRPDLAFTTIRGNVDTRLRKLREGDYDAIVLAAAGLERLGLRATHTVAFDPDVIVPAAGQGALAIEVRAEDETLAARIHAAFADRPTERAVQAERAFLRTLRAGCQAPVGAYATFAGETLTLAGAIAALDGSRIVRGTLAQHVRDAAEAERLGSDLARRLLAEGGAELLALAADREPLAGRLFLLPRTVDRPSRIAPALRGAGAEVLEAIDSAQAAGALASRVPDALLFPSSGSVAAIGGYLAGLRTSGARPVVATMGPATTAAARAAGFEPDVVADEANVAAFVQSVTQFMLKVGE